MKKRCFLELLSPSNLLFFLNAHHQLIQCFNLLLFFSVSNDLDNGSVFLGNLNGRWLCIIELKTKDFIAFFLRILAFQNLD